MRCPYCNSKKINVIKEDLIVADDPDATGGRTSNKCLIYDESILHDERDGAKEDVFVLALVM